MFSRVLPWFYPVLGNGGSLKVLKEPLRVRKSDEKDDISVPKATF